jgi:hypothetical protein
VGISGNGRGRLVSGHGAKHGQGGAQVVSVEGVLDNCEGLTADATGGGDLLVGEGVPAGGVIGGPWAVVRVYVALRA